MSSVQTIRFCPQCDNKYYHSISEDENLLYFCRVCRYTDSSISNKGLCILETQYRAESDNVSYENVIHRFTKYDPTLPRLYIPCPNEQCKTSEKKEDTEVIYLRYDDKKMLYLYRCMACDYTWKTHSGSN